MKRTVGQELAVADVEVDASEVFWTDDAAVPYHKVEVDVDTAFGTRQGIASGVDLGLLEKIGDVGHLHGGHTGKDGVGVVVANSAEGW